MQPQPAFGFQQLITELLRGLADALADRPEETEAQRFARHQTAIFSVMAMLPRDATEALVAGHCVIYDELLRNAAADLLRSEAEPARRRIRTQVTALGRMFLKSLEQLRQLQDRPTQQDAQEASAVPTPRSEDAPPSADIEPAAEEPQTATQQGDDKADVPLQPAFQNRQMRRALQFKKPSAKRPSRRLPYLAAASQSAATSGLRGA